MRASGEGSAGIDALLVVRVAAAFDKGAHRTGGLGLAQQYTVHAAPEDLAELPGVVAHVCFVGAVDRRFDDDGRGAVARARRAGFDKAGQVFGKPGHVEGAVLHPDIDVVGPGAGIFAPLRAVQPIATMTAEIVDRLVLRQQLDGAIDRVRHLASPLQLPAPQPMALRSKVVKACVSHEPWKVGGVVSAGPAARVAWIAGLWQWPSAK